jgi:uncharacterized protein (DUF934 family)
MPRRLLRDGRVVVDDWSYAAEVGGTADAALILAFAQWQNEREAWLADGRWRLGLVLSPGHKVESLAPDLSRLALIAVEFSGPSDGRGYSQARLLREQWNFCGELRAVGYVRRDQLFFMARCGFNSFELPDTDIDAAHATFADFSWAYQPSNDMGLPVKLRHRWRDIPASAGSAGPLSGPR